ncbi:hypothetical protein G6F37_011551 [Rhizopus arrhizus]|nr:hypothetical protein G6F38_007868 [Rhizopus arrhizus]KAG1148737.1 hypothetical protein G6F37_011551 [Rhizopus arrhizus]
MFNDFFLASRLVLTLFLHSAAANQASFLVQNVENLSDIPSESVDAYTIAFGIRTRIHVESIHKFSPQEKIVQIICDAGFKTVGKVYEDLTFGVVAIHSDYKI